ncbi:MAG: phosphatase PAP2 family protein [Cytophagales bacterium]|nr:phosphatase PAP2 family protein [Cytophagales bacterium]
MDIAHILEIIDKGDKALFLMLNALHHPYIDPVMYWVTQTKTWIPMYACFLYLIIKKYKIKSIYIAIAVALLITFTDRFTSGFMKPYFKRLRPCHDTEIKAKVHTVDGCGGEYGMASSHASNTFGAAMLLCLLFAFESWWPATLLWAAVVSYSRIYVGVHYPCDVWVGAMVGVLGALGVYYLLFAMLNIFKK